MSNEVDDYLAALLGDTGESASASDGGLWVLLFVEGDSLSDDDRRVIAEARTHADGLGAAVTAVLAGTSSESATGDARACGADRAVTCADDIDALASMIAESHPETILVRAGSHACEVGARLAVRAGGCYVGEAIALEVDTTARRLAAHCAALGGRVIEVRAAEDEKRPHVIALRG